MIRRLLALSLIVNVVAVLGVGYWLHKHGLRDAEIKLHLAAAAAPDYPVLARERFGPLPSSDAATVVAGDSQVQNAPLADLVTDFRQRGIGGQTIADLTAWLPGTLTATTRRVVLEVGTNDILGHRTASDATVDYQRLIAAVRLHAPHAQIVMLSVPPLSYAVRTVRAYNATLRTLADQQHARWVDITTPLAGPDGGFVPAYSDADRTHINAAGYGKVAAVLRQALG